MPRDSNAGSRWRLASATGSTGERRCLCLRSKAGGSPGATLHLRAGSKAAPRGAGGLGLRGGWLSVCQVVGKAGGTRSRHV